MNSEAKLISRKTKAIIALAATLISTTAISSAAFAVPDSKAYPGSLCDVQTPDFNNKVSRAAGQFLNNGTSSVDAHCPGVRENTSSADNGIGPTGFVLVTNSNAAAKNIRCQLRAYKADGSLNFNSKELTFSVPGGAPGTPGKLKFNFTQPVQQTPDGGYEIFCSLPASTSIVNYKITE